MSDDVPDDFGKRMREHLATRVAVIAANRERLLEAWIAQHGWNPDECLLMVQDMSDGNVLTQRIWIEKRGDFEELKRLRMIIKKT